MNAKELILAKINATPELVDIYTYLTAVGTPFLDIADYMTCESFGFITKAGEVNVFDKSTHSRKVKNAIGWYLGEKLLDGTDTDLLKQVLNPYQKWSNEQLIQALQDRSVIEKAITYLYNYLENPPKKASYDEFTAYRSELENAQIFYYRYLGFENIPLEDIKGLINVLEWELEKLDFKQNLSDPIEEYRKLKAINDILPNVEEMSIMGAAQGINQGQRTDLYHNRAFIKRINDFIKRKNIFDNKSERSDTPEANSMQEFDFERFILDEQYRQFWINAYENVKYTFNILDALTKLPHFWEMLKTTAISKNAIKESSWRSRTIWNLADKIEANNAWVSEDNWKSLDYYINDFVIASFLKENDISFKIPKGTIYYSGMGLEGKLENKVDGYTIHLDSVIGVASFKRFVEDVVIPSLKRDINFSTNPFIANLVPYASLSNERVITGWKLPLDMMNIDASPNTKLLFADILRGFDEIANQSMFGIKLGDLFYLYNLVVNKDSYGRSSMTRLFENQINQDNTDSIPNRFNEYISKLDSGEIQLDVDYDEAIYRIKKMDSNFRVKSNLNVNLRLPSDFTLDLPKFFDLPIDSSRRLSVQESTERNIDYGSSDAILAIAQSIAQKYNAGVILITDDELSEFPEDARNAKAFIRDGNVYVNINSASASDSIHELAHLVLAAMKFSDDQMIRSTYYNLIAKMKDPNIVSEAVFNTITRKYVGEDGIITSDVLEEVLANEFAYYLSGELLKDTNKIITVDTETTLLNAIGNVLELDKAPTLADIQGKSITDIMKALGKAIVNTNAIDKNFVLRTQRVAKMEDLVRKNKTLTCK